MYGLVLAFVPPVRALFECFIVSIFIFFDHSFETDVSPDFITEMVALQEK